MDILTMTHPEFDPETNINIGGLDKALVLKTLVDNASCIAMDPIVSALSAHLPLLPIEQAQAIIDRDGLTVDYVGGKPIKVDITGDTLNPWLYDRDHGSGAAARAIDSLRESQHV